MSAPVSATRPVVLGVVKRRLWSGTGRDLRGSVAFQAKAYDRAVLLVRLFYVASLMWIIRTMNTWTDLLSAEAADPLWPTWWLDRVGLDRGVPLILVGWTVTGILATLVPQWRPARLAFFVFMLQYWALRNGFGKISHGMHPWLFVSGILVFLPRHPWAGPTRVSHRHHFLTVIIACQLIVLFFYMLTGFWKGYFNLEALLRPERVSSLELSGFSYILARPMVEFGRETLVGDFVVRHQVLGWALFNFTIYLELFSLFIAFRPRLHRVWGLGLILFHAGTQAAMNFTFLENVLLLGLLLVCSPVAPDRVVLREALADLPGVHWLVRRSRRRRAGVGADPPGRPAGDGAHPSAEKELTAP